MKGAVLFVEGKGPPPRDLDNFLKWRTFGVLPNAGGLRDQRVGELDRMISSANVYEAWRVFKDRPSGWEKYPTKLFEMIMDLCLFIYTEQPPEFGPLSRRIIGIAKKRLDWYEHRADRDYPRGEGRGNPYTKEV